MNDGKLRLVALASVGAASDLRVISINPSRESWTMSMSMSLTRQDP
jgi:hypothetical protein